jgi:hypothetical protein
MGQSKKAETALIGLGIGGGALALVVLFFWVLFSRRGCNASSRTNSSLSSVSDMKLPPSTENSNDTVLPPSAPSSPPPPWSPTMTRTRMSEESGRPKEFIIGIEIIGAASSPRRNQQKSNVHISHKENGRSIKAKWRTSFASLDHHYKTRKAKAKPNPPPADAAHDSSSRPHSVDPFALYDSEYGALYLRNEATTEAIRLAGWKQKALQTILEVENGSDDGDGGRDDSNSVLNDNLPLDKNSSAGGYTAKDEAPHASSTGADCGRSSSWAWLTCYSSPPLIHAEL